MIIFCKLRWKNLLSTGNVFTEIDLNKFNTTLIVGENGAGKSTFMKILSGGVTPDSGSIDIDGVSYPGVTVQLARKLGIGIMYQELRLFQHRDVLTNLFPDREIRRGPFIARKPMEEIAMKKNVHH